eukprot:COSAG05_NODE_204_length_14187_cov_99.887422_16_plen_55_part_00
MMIHGLAGVGKAIELTLAAGCFGGASPRDTHGGFAASAAADDNSSAFFLSFCSN